MIEVRNPVFIEAIANDPDLSITYKEKKMESKLNADIRKVLELFEIDTTKVIGDWSIIGHLVDAAKKNGAVQ